jgi:hypothetical protein
MCIDGAPGHARRALLAGLLGASLAWAGEPSASALDGRWRLQADGERLHLLEAGGARVKSFDAASLDGARRSRVAAVRHAAARRSFVVAFETLAELWEISLDTGAEPIYNGLVHDFRLREGVSEPGYLGARRTPLDQPLRELLLDRSGAHAIGRAADTADGLAVLHVVHLDVRRRIAAFTVDADPDLASGEIAWRDGRERLRLPDRRGGPALELDLQTLRLQRLP